MVAGMAIVAFCTLRCLFFKPRARRAFRDKGLCFWGKLETEGTFGHLGFADTEYVRPAPRKGALSGGDAWVVRIRSIGI